MDTEFEQLYNTYYMQVYSYVMTLGKDRQLAEEITQKTFFKVMTTAHGYRGAAATLTWLCAIAKNLYLDFCRKRRRDGDLPEQVAADGDMAEALADEELSFRIHQVLHQLEEPYKEVFGLWVFGELPFKKIGALFEKSENWARVTYHRARLKLRERMESE
nr:RNA polymerase sigma factor [Neobittarella massiliensis]